MFIPWRYFHHTILFYLSISNAIDNVLRHEPFSVVLVSSHSAIPSKGILAIIARIFVNLFTISFTVQLCRFIFCLLSSKLIRLFIQFPYPMESSPFISLLIPMFSTHSRTGCHSGFEFTQGFLWKPFWRMQLLHSLVYIFISRVSASVDVTTH